MKYKFLSILFIFSLAGLACRGTANPSAEESDTVSVLKSAAELPPGNPERGENLFLGQEKEPVQCAACHSLIAGETKVGPSLDGVSEIAASRIEGISAENYLYNSIFDPNEYIVDGYHGDVMPEIYGQHLSDQDMADLLAFLMNR